MKAKNIYLSLSLFSSLLWESVAFSRVGSGMATQPFTAHNSFSGFYVSGSVGYSSLGAKEKGYWHVGNIVALGPVVLNAQKDCVSKASSFDVGIGHNFFLNDRWVLGLEGHGMWDGHKAKSVSNTSLTGVEFVLSGALKKKFGVGLKAKLGYMLNDNLYAYGGVGLNCSTFTYQYTTNSLPRQGKNSKKLWGVSPLVGMRMGVNDRLSLDFGYSYTFYQGLSIDHFMDATHRVYRSFKPRYSVAHIGLAYKIN